MLAQTHSCHCRYPHVTVVKCVAHSLDLLLEDIGKVSYFSDIIEAQKRIVRFITNHHYSLGLFRQFAHKQLLKTGGCSLSTTMNCLYGSCARIVVALTVAVHTAAETCFYGTQIVAEHMLELKAPIMQTVVSQEWADWMTGSGSARRFWARLEPLRPCCNWRHFGGGRAALAANVRYPCSTRCQHTNGGAPMSARRRLGS